MKDFHMEFPIKKMAQVFKVSRAGYYKHINKKPSLTETVNKDLTSKIKFIFEKSRCTYGSPRIHAILKKQEVSCSRKRVAKITDSVAKYDSV